MSLILRGRRESCIAGIEAWQANSGSRGTVCFAYDDLHTTHAERLAVWEGKPFRDLAEMQEAELEVHGISADPRFVDPAAGDFSLRPGSPCIDKGLHIPVINDGFAGKGPDMDAHERRLPTRRWTPDQSGVTP